MSPPGVVLLLVTRKPTAGRPLGTAVAPVRARWDDDQAHLVDQAGCQQSLREPGRAVQLELAPWPSLELGDLRRDVARRIVVGDQVASVNVCEATYFGSPFICSVNGRRDR